MSFKNLRDRLPLRLPSIPYQGFHNFKRILVTSQSNLIDYQIKIELNNQNFPFEECRKDGADIRLVDSYGNKLNYWLEQWNSSSGIIWCKVPYIHKGENNLWLIFGNPSASSNSNGENVFEFFEGFDYVTGRWNEAYENNPIITAPSGYLGSRYPSVIYDADEEKYKVWYDVLDNSSPYSISIWYADSPDGLNWSNHQQVFTPTNVTGDFDGQAVSVGTVIKATNNSYQMWYIGRYANAGNLSNGIGFAVSSDGINWSRNASNPLATTGADLNCSFVSGATVIHDDKWRMVIQTDRTGTLQLYKGASDYPDKNWSFESSAFITNGGDEVNEARLIKLNDTYYVIHPYDSCGACCFTLTYANSTDWSNWDTYVETLMPYESGITGIKHFPGVLIPYHHGGNYVLTDNNASLYIYWSWGTTGDTCNDATDWRISVAFFDNFPQKTAGFSDKWDIVYHEGSRSFSNSLIKLSNNDGTREYYIAKNISLPPPLTAEVRAKYSASGNGMMIFPLRDSGLGSNYVFFIPDSAGAEMKYYSQKDGTTTSITNGSYLTGVFYKYKLEWTSNKNKYYIYNDDGSLFKSEEISTNVPIIELKPIFYGSAYSGYSTDHYIDYIFMRKYASREPEVIV